MPNPVVSIVFVNWNGREVLLDCLRSLRSNSPTVAWEALVIDNASSDGSAEAVRHEAPWTRLVVNPSNNGLAAANNQAFELTEASEVLLCNSDILFSPGAVDRLHECLQRHQRAAFAIPRLLNSDGSTQTSVGDLPTVTDALLGRRVGRILGRDRHSGTGFWWDGWPHDEEREVGHGAEACYLIRREAVDEIGLQDRSFWLDWEGIEWSARARDHGWEVWFCPGAEITHLGGVSIRQNQIRWVVASHRGIYRYFRKRLGALWAIPLGFIFGLRAAVKIIAVVLDRKTYDRALKRAPVQDH